MKISGSIKQKFLEQEENARQLQKILEPRILSWCKTNGWYYVDRIKREESYAQKIEQSRIKTINDVYAGTIVVKNKIEVEKCCQLLEQNAVYGMKFQYKLPKYLNKATSSADTFRFDSVRMYFKAAKPDIGKPDYLDEEFEIQIKTLLDDAWGKASHDFFYKTDEKLSWAKQRLMSQIKALLENAEIALTNAETLSKIDILQKNDDKLDELNNIIDFYQENWKNKSDLPKDLKRLAENTLDLLDYLPKDNDLAWLDNIIKSETKSGKGTNILDLSPYWIVVYSIIQNMGWKIFLDEINNVAKKKEKEKCRKSLPLPIIQELLSELPPDIDLKNYPNIRKI